MAASCDVIEETDIKEETRKYYKMRKIHFALLTLENYNQSHACFLERSRKSSEKESRSDARYTLHTLFFLLATRVKNSNVIFND